MSNPQIEALEEQVILLAGNLRLIRKDIEAKGGHYGDNYNHLGTLKVNLLALIREANKVAEAIKINA